MDGDVMSSRDAILGRVRQSLDAASKAASPLPERGTVGYQGAGPDPLARFVETATAMGAKPYVVANRDELLQRIAAILDATAAKKVLLGAGIESLGLEPWLRETGREVTRLGCGPVERDALFAADVGITGVAGLLAETGSLIVRATSIEPRSGSLLPPVHIAIGRRDQIVADVFDVFENAGSLPSNLVLITGPSKTGDIELKLVTGVHGPGEVHVIVM
jgi:L-lactate dehydrogenase complex protein LldG